MGKQENITPNSGELFGVKVVPCLVRYYFAGQGESDPRQRVYWRVRKGYRMLPLGDFSRGNKLQSSKVAPETNYEIYLVTGGLNDPETTYVTNQGNTWKVLRNGHEFIGNKSYSVKPEESAVIFGDNEKITITPEVKQVLIVNREEPIYSAEVDTSSWNIYDVAIPMQQS